MKPSIGRVVWVYPDGHDRGAQPLAGLIAYVHSDDLINLNVVAQDGRAFPLTSVKLVAADEDTPPAGNVAVWMPYQIEQAAKADAATKEIMDAGKAALKAAKPAPAPTLPAIGGTPAPDTF